MVAAYLGYKPPEDRDGTGDDDDGEEAGEWECEFPDAVE